MEKSETDETKTQGERVMSLSFKGSPERLERIQQMLHRLLEEAGEQQFDPQGPIADWGQSGGWVQDIDGGWSQSGGWYLVIENERALMLGRPDESLKQVTKNVYKALSRAEQLG